MGTCFIYLCLETKINPNKYDETKKKQKNKNKHENYYLRCTMIAIDDTLPKMEVFIYLFKQIYIFFLSILCLFHRSIRFNIFNILYIIYLAHEYTNNNNRFHPKMNAI